MNRRKRVPKKHPGIAWRMVAGEAVIVVPRRGTVMTLNGVGSTLFSLVDGKRSVGDMVRVLVETFETDEATALRDAAAFLDDLSRQEVVEFP